MTPQTPQTDGSRAEADAALPHERDQQAPEGAAATPHPGNRNTMERAHRDAESKITDTERIGTPNDVPSADDNTAPER